MAGVSKQDFLDLHVIAAEALRKIVDEGHRLKAARRGLGQAAPDPDARQQDKLLAMIFEKPSTRTRVSFDAGMRQLGGQTLNLGGGEMQLGRGETIADTARVLSRYVDAIMIRTSGHDKLLELAEYAEVPVINGLTNFSHPCQLIADLMTFEEHRGPIAGRSVAWCGDGNNVATSWIHAAVQFGFELRLACPDEFAPDPAVLRWAADQRGKVHVTADAQAAVEGTHCVVTDTWVSMGDKDAERRHKLLAPYQVNEKLMDLAAVDAVFMHCLPAHRGEEVTVGVIDGPQSVIFDEAENRLHAQKSILNWCLG
ncbi:MAG TPA: ornithine carbamoyltransferase [Alphaproteobacteria bacterium]|jgi:ornithine carbamoyltransferase|nr:ornithine carbamoyltransferase [Alphaproteobacteria bacterium]HBC53109.1 ornithine carbamoyltransferase [Alphaproteobacteria bacterium]HBF98053.1 ornithine carbamoyltransferase [Alphaproteobacteria bacterium]